MSRRRGPGARSDPLLAALGQVLDLLGRRRRGPRWRLQLAIAVGTLALLGVLALAALWRQWFPARLGPAPPPAEGGYLLCSWNAENLFDDVDDPRNHDEDEDWFARDPAAFTLKLRLLADALLGQADGRGPDIVALVEVESRRAVEKLRDELNGRLPPELAYTTIIQRDNLSGRRFAPAVLSRLPGRDNLTRTFGALRILEAHLEVDGAPLVLLVSHWTSRLRDGSEERRAVYADQLYARVRELLNGDPAADLLLCGDFNDEPDDTSLVEHLHATADPAEVRPGDPSPRLWDLLAGRDPASYGTYYLNGRWEILDHILLTPGLLDDAGWRALPETLKVVNPPGLRSGRSGAPHRFGNPAGRSPRGASDHFALTLRMSVRDRASAP